MLIVSLLCCVVSWFSGVEMMQHGCHGDCGGEGGEEEAVFEGTRAFNGGGYDSQIEKL